MSVIVEYINEHTVVMRYQGLLNFEDRFKAYTELLEYSHTHELRYILLDDVAMMYRTEGLFDERLSKIIKEGLSQDSFRAIILINNSNQDIQQKLKQNYTRLGIAHKLYFVKGEAAGFTLIEQLENEANSPPSENTD